MAKTVGYAERRRQEHLTGSSAQGTFHHGGCPFIAGLLHGLAGLSGSDQ